MPPRLDLSGKQPGMSMTTGVIKTGVNAVTGAVRWVKNIRWMKGAVTHKKARMK